MSTRPSWLRRRLRLIREPRQTVRLLAALCAQAAVVVAFRLVPFRWLAGMSRDAGGSLVVEAAVVDGWVEAVRRSSPLLGRWSTCLSRALAAEWLLACAGQPATVCVGISGASPDAFDAHAWLECGGRCLLGEPRERVYVELARIRTSVSSS